MEKRNFNNEQEVKRSAFDERKKRNPSKSSQINQKELPWWVELLFVQIGFPDRWLIRILKTKKNAVNFYKENNKFIFLIFLFLLSLGYFQPVIKYSNTKLKCQKTAFNFLNKISRLKNENHKILEMITVNYCNGGSEIEYLRKDN